MSLFGAACAPEDAVVEVPDVATDMVGGYLSDPARSGVVSGSVGDSPVVEYRIEGDAPVIASPVLAGSTGFVPDGAGDLIAFEVATGDVVWRTPIGETDASVVVSSDAVFSVSGDGVARRHDRRTGDILWEADLDGATRSSPVLFGGDLWIAAGERLAVLDPASGVRRSSIALESRADSSPAATGGVVVIGTRSNMLAFVDTTSMTVEFVALPEPSDELTTYADGVAATPVISGGSIYVGSTAGALLSLGLSGDIEWQVDVGSPIYGAVAIGEGVGFVPTGAGRLIAFDLDDGDERWSAELGDAAYSSPISVGGVVLTTAENGRLFAFDAESGDELWSLEVGEPGNFMASSPAMSGTLVVLGSNDGSIVGVDTDR